MNLIGILLAEAAAGGFDLAAHETVTFRRGWTTHLVYRGQPETSVCDKRNRSTTRTTLALNELAIVNRLCSDCVTQAMFRSDVPNLMPLRIWKAYQQLTELAERARAEVVSGSIGFGRLVDMLTVARASQDQTVARQALVLAAVEPTLWKAFQDAQTGVYTLIGELAQLDQVKKQMAEYCTRGGSEGNMLDEAPWYLIARESSAYHDSVEGYLIERAYTRDGDRGQLILAPRAVIEWLLSADSKVHDVLGLPASLPDDVYDTAAALWDENTDGILSHLDGAVEAAQLVS